MIGSAAVAAWIALIVFWCLLAWGWASDELGPTGLTVALALWLAANVALRYLGYSAVFPSFVALLDVALVLIVFKGDIPIT